MRTHPHRCPICRKAFNCVGVRCAPFNGIPHKACDPTNRFAHLTHEIADGEHAIRCGRCNGTGVKRLYGQQETCGLCGGRGFVISRYRV